MALVCLEVLGDASDVVVMAFVLICKLVQGLCAVIWDSPFIIFKKCFSYFLLVILMRWFGIIEGNIVINFLFRRLRRLITATRVHLIYFVAVECRDLEINAPKFDDVSDTHYLLLVVWKKVFEHFVNRAFFANDEPHRPLKLDVVFFVLFHLLLVLWLVDKVWLMTPKIRVGDFRKVLLVQLRPIESPKCAITGFEEQPQNYLLVGKWILCILVDSSAFHALNIAASAFSQEDPIAVGFNLRMAFAAGQFFIFEFDKLVFFVFVHTKIWAVEVKKAVRKLVTGKRPYCKAGLV